MPKIKPLLGPGTSIRQATLAMDILAGVCRGLPSQEIAASLRLRNEDATGLKVIGLRYLRGIGATIPSALPSQYDSWDAWLMHRKEQILPLVKEFQDKLNTLPEEDLGGIEWGIQRDLRLLEELLSGKTSREAAAMVGFPISRLRIQVAWTIRDIRKAFPEYQGLHNPIEDFKSAKAARLQWRGAISQYRKYALDKVAGQYCPESYAEERRARLAELTPTDSVYYLGLSARAIKQLTSASIRTIDSLLFFVEREGESLVKSIPNLGPMVANEIAEVIAEYRLAQEPVTVPSRKLRP